MSNMVHMYEKLMYIRI